MLVPLPSNNLSAFVPTTLHCSTDQPRDSPNIGFSRHFLRLGLELPLMFYEPATVSQGIVYSVTDCFHNLNALGFREVVCFISQLPRRNLPKSSTCTSQTGSGYDHPIAQHWGQQPTMEIVPPGPVGV